MLQSQRRTMHAQWVFVAKCVQDRCWPCMLRPSTEGPASSPAHCVADACSDPGLGFTVPRLCLLSPACFNATPTPRHWLHPSVYVGYAAGSNTHCKIGFLDLAPGASRIVSHSVCERFGWGGGSVTRCTRRRPLSFSCATHPSPASPRLLPSRLAWPQGCPASR